MVLVCAPSAAGAHQSSIVYSEILVRGRVVAYTFQIADTELGPALGLGERAVARDDVKQRQSALLTYLTERVQVTNAGYPCDPDPRGVELADKADGFFALATIDYECKRTAADVSVEYNLFFDLDPRHQGFARVTLPGQAPQEQVFKESRRELRLTQTVTLFDHARDYLVLGIEHIFTGYDHIAFLFGLLVVAGFASLRGGLRYVLGIVTAFTVAHSITLIASGLDWVRLPPIVVEPAIALSITYVAVENLVTATPRFRWLLTFGFGLVHGFGFASVLREIGLPPRGLVLSLLSFNVGVELGQLAVVALAAPALYLLAKGKLDRRAIAVLALLSAAAFLLLMRFHLPRVQLGLVVIGVPVVFALVVPRVGYDRAVRLGGSALLVGLAVFWFFERILAKTLLGGVLG